MARSPRHSPASRAPGTLLWPVPRARAAPRGCGSWPAPAATSPGCICAPPHSPTGRWWRRSCRATSFRTSRLSTRALSSATPARIADMPLDLVRRLLTPLRNPVPTSRYPLSLIHISEPTRGLPAIDPARCDKNGACIEICPTDAIEFVVGADSASHPRDGMLVLGGGLLDQASGLANRTAALEYASSRPPTARSAPPVPSIDAG